MLTMVNNARLTLPAEDPDDKGLRPSQMVILIGFVLYVSTIVWGRLTGEISLFGDMEFSYALVIYIGIAFLIVCAFLSRFLESKGM